MPTLASVIHASVFSGGISDTEPTKVVLPTLKPPATTIFAETASCPGGGTAAGRSDGEPFETIEDPSKHLAIVVVAVRGGMDVHRALRRQVADQHPDDAERGGDGHRQL